MRLPSIFTPSRSLSGRITLWVTASILAIFVIITVFLYKTTADGIFYEANARYQGVLDRNNERVHATLKAVEVAISNAVPLVEENLDSPERLFAVVERVVALNPDIVGSAIAFEPNYYAAKGQWFSPYAYRNGTALETKQLGTVEYEYHYMDWYQIPKLLGCPIWSEPYFDTDGGNTMMTTYSLPLCDRHGELYAVFTADISLEWLSRMMQQTDSINNNGRGKDVGHAYSFIIGRGGTYIAHPDTDRILSETFFSYSMETPDSVDDNIGYEMIDGHQGNAKLVTDEGDCRIYYSPIERTGWSMAIVVPEHEIIAVAEHSGITIICLMIIGLAIVFLICHYTIARVTTPLTRFADSADEIARGHFDAQLPEVSTRDEMSRLRDSFHTMQHSLNRQIQETIRVTEQKGRMESELNIARTIQMSMLPKTFPPYPDCDEVTIFARLDPAKAVGGDLYDFYIRDGRLFFCIGDVSGKGVPASLVMAVIRTLFRTVSAHEENPDSIVVRINDTMAEDNETNMFVTLFVGVIDLQTGHMDYCNAGHNAPLLISESGRRVGLLPVDSNLPVGVMQGWTFTMQETNIDNGTTIFLYTDGLNEAENICHQQFGDDRVLLTARNASSSSDNHPRALVEKMVSSVHDFVGEAEQSDDLTIMAIQYAPKETTASKHRHSITLPNDIETIPQLHDFIEEVVGHVALDSSQIMSLNLAIEEAVVNVMEYAYPNGTKGTVNIVASAANGVLSFVISDNGKPFDPTAKAEVDTTLSAEERPIGGLGIHLIRQIMDEVSYERKDDKNILTLRKKLNNN